VVLGWGVCGVLVCGGDGGGGGGGGHMMLKMQIVSWLAHSMTDRHHLAHVFFIVESTRTE